MQVLRVQLAVKEAQIAAKDRQIGEVHVLLQQAQRALPAAVVEELATAATPEAAEEPEPSRRTWRQVWTR